MKVSLYQDPEIYDILHWPGTPGEVAGLLKTARRFVDGPCRCVLEPACGSGRYLRAMVGRGLSVIGFDLEPPMVRYALKTVTGAAKRRTPAPKVTIFRADMRTFGGKLKAGSADFAFNPINTIRHLSSDAAMIRHLNQVAKVVRPGGVYIVGISLSAYGIEGITEDLWTGSRGNCRVTQVITYFPPASTGAKARDERVHSHLSISTPKGHQDADSTYVLRTHNLSQWQSVVKRSRLQIIASVDEEGRDHIAAEPGYCIFVLAHRTKPGSVTRR